VAVWQIACSDPDRLSQIESAAKRQQLRERLG